MGESWWSRLVYADDGRIRLVWKVLPLVAIVAFPLAIFLAGRDSGGEGATTSRLEAISEGEDPADDAGEPVDDAGDDDDDGTTTTTVPASTGPTLPAANQSQPPVDAFGVYAQGKVVLRGSVPTTERGEAYRQRIGAVIGLENVRSELTVDPRVRAETIDVDVEERFTFPSGSVNYDVEFDALLTLGAFALKLLPEATLVVTGHTDSIGDEGTNLALSVARAQLVADFMVRGGIPRDRIVARGAGEAEPIADNATEEGRQANRRIEARFEGVRPA